MPRGRRRKRSSSSSDRVVGEKNRFGATGKGSSEQRHRGFIILIVGEKKWGIVGDEYFFLFPYLFGELTNNKFGEENI